MENGYMCKPATQRRAAKGATTDGDDRDGRDGSNDDGDCGWRATVVVAAAEACARLSHGGARSARHTKTEGGGSGGDKGGGARARAVVCSYRRWRPP